MLLPIQILQVLPTPLSAQPIFQVAFSTHHLAHVPPYGYISRPLSYTVHLFVSCVPLQDGRCHDGFIHHGTPAPSTGLRNHSSAS